MEKNIYTHKFGKITDLKLIHSEDFVPKICLISAKGNIILFQFQLTNSKIIPQKNVDHVILASQMKTDFPMQESDSWRIVKFARPKGDTFASFVCDTQIAVVRFPRPSQNGSQSDAVTVSTFASPAPERVKFTNLKYNIARGVAYISTSTHHLYKVDIDFEHNKNKIVDDEDFDVLPDAPPGTGVHQILYLRQQAR